MKDRNESPVRREKSNSIDLPEKIARKTSAALQDIPVMNEDWKHLNRYRNAKQKIDTEFRRFNSLRIKALLAVFAGFLLHVITQNKIQNNTRVSKVSLELFWQRIFMNGSPESGYTSNEKLMEQIYSNLYNVFHINDVFFTQISTANLKVRIRYLNINTEDTHNYIVPNNPNFGRENVTEVLKLPLNLNDPAKFKVFFDNFDTLTIIITELLVCYFKEFTEGCYKSDLHIRYIRYGYKYYGRATSFVRRAKPNLQAEQSADFPNQFPKSLPSQDNGATTPKHLQNKIESKFQEKKDLLDPLFELNEDHNFTIEKNKNAFNQTFDQADHSDGNLFVSAILLILSAWGLWMDVRVLRSIQLDKCLEKHFELKLIVFSQEKVFKDQLANASPKRLGVLFLLSFSKNLLLIYYCLAFLFPSIVKISSGINLITQALGFLAAVEILLLRKDIGLILPVLKNSIGFFISSFLGYFAVSVAIILAANLLNETSAFFESPHSSFLAFFSLMTGDSVLLIFDSIKPNGWIATIGLTLALLFFVFCFQSLYIMIVTDSFLSMIEIDAQGDVAQTELEGQKPDNFSRRNADPGPGFMELIVEEKFDPLQTKAEKIEHSEREITIIASRKEQKQSLRQSPPANNHFDEGNWHKELDQNDRNFPPNDTSSVYADSRDQNEVNTGNLPAPLPLNAAQSPPLIKTRDNRSRISTATHQKMFTDEKDEIQLFNNVHQDVQAQFKSMMGLEMDIFGKIKKLLSASLKMMTNFDKMYAKQCMEFVQANINKQKAKVLEMRRSI